MFLILIQPHPFVHKESPFSQYPVGVYLLHAFPGMTKGSVLRTPKMKRSVNYVKKRGINPYQSNVTFRTKDMMTQALRPYD